MIEKGIPVDSPKLTLKFLRTPLIAGGVLVTLIGAVVLCKQRSTPRTTCPRSSLPEPLVCPNVPGSTINEMPHNEMPHNEMPHNGLSAWALANNSCLLRDLATTNLRADVLTANADLAKLLAEPYAADIVKYIAACALDPCDQIEIPTGPALQVVRDRFGSSFRGELGLCGKKYNDWAASASPASASTTWRDAAADAACLERVSSCVLARTNAVAYRVPFSMRGDGLKTGPKVLVERQFREDGGTPIVSFRRCDEQCLWGDPLARNCDWEPRHVGQCTADETVTLVLGPARTVKDTRVRICAGIYGCDSYARGAGAVTVPVTDLPHYGGVKLQEGIVVPGSVAGPSADPDSEIKFKCPRNGPKVGRVETGYYSVMLGAPLGGGALDPDLDLTPGKRGEPERIVVAPNAYPATEEAVFSYREGAFFGTLFGTPTTSVDIAAPPSSHVAESPPPPPPVSRTRQEQKPAQQAPVPESPQHCPQESKPDQTCAPVSLSGHQYACYSGIWSKGEAMLAHRLCAGVTEMNPRGCFENAPMPCDDGTVRGQDGVCEPQPPELADTCDGLSEANGRWQATAFSHPYTSYVNHPCDLWNDESACLRALDLKDEDTRGVTARRAPQVKDLRAEPSPDAIRPSL